MPAVRRKRFRTARQRGGAPKAPGAKGRGTPRAKAGANGGGEGGGGSGAERKRSALARLSHLGGASDLAVLAADDSGVLRIRLIVSVVTYVANLLLDLIAILARKRKAKHAAPASLEQASDALAKGGIGDGLISRTEVYDCKSGHTFEVWEVGRWGADPARMEVLGAGATLGDAIGQWVKSTRSAVRDRFTGAR